MKTLAYNRQAKRSYQILETFEAGLVLKGCEVKSIKSGQINLKGSYVSIDSNQELYLVKAHISLYKKSNIADYDPERPRKLLLHKREINSLTGKLRQKGLTLTPLKVYTKRGIIKLEFALAKGKKKWDKRQDIKKRETDREIARSLKNH